VELQRNLPAFAKAGAAIYAASADPPPQVARAIREWKVTFNVIPDPSAEILRPFGVLSPNGEQPLPATFVIDRDGIVRFRHVGTGPGDRPPVRKVLEAVREIAGAGRP
jgi:peroxiredoxin